MAQTDAHPLLPTSRWQETLDHARISIPTRLHACPAAVISLGPFSLKTVLAVVAVLIAWLALRWRLRHEPGDRRKAGGALFTDMVIIGLISGRLAFMAMAPAGYLADPMAIVRIADGGFLPWPGLAVALGFAYWRTRPNTRLRSPLVTGAAVGMGTWLGSMALLAMLQASIPLPDAPLTTMSGQATSLTALSGKPMVINLWATWCPPCRREMPVLAQAQRRYTTHTFVLVNQGEPRATVQAYLEAAGLNVSNILLDPQSDTLRQSGSRGLPTTLFFDAQGRLVDTHLGELTLPALEAKLQRLSAPARAIPRP